MESTVWNSNKKNHFGGSSHLASISPRMGQISPRIEQNIAKLKNLYNVKISVFWVFKLFFDVQSHLASGVENLTRKTGFKPIKVDPWASENLMFGNLVIAE